MSITALCSKYRWHVLLLILVVLVIGAILGAYYKFILCRRRLDLDVATYRRALDKIVPLQIEGYVATLYDPDTGWDFRPHLTACFTNAQARAWTFTLDATGSRTNAYPSERVRISTYGDSFAFCDEVNDNQTWPYFLSELTDTKVLNYGTMGFGTDQALLKLERNLRAGRGTELVILEFMSEDLCRILNLYRPFLTRTPTDALAFKPMFVQRGTGRRFELVNPLPRPPQTVRDLQRALRVVEHNDYWYNLSQAKLMALNAAGGMPWSDPRALATLSYIIERFVTLSETAQFKPVLVFIPFPRELELQAKKQACPYQAFAAELRRRYRPDQLLVVDILEQPFDAAKFNIRPYWEAPSHASEYGNRIIAQTLYAALQKQGWLDANPVAGE